MRIALFSLLFLVLTGGLATAAPTGSVHALVVGINDYGGGVRNLDGAVNDAEDVAAALRKTGVGDVTQLLNAAASRKAILDVLERFARDAAPGQTYIFHYAGHGAQRPIQGGEPDADGDGLLEVLVLQAAFKNNDPSELIADKEISRIARDITSRGARMMIIADSCHGGGLSRGTSLNRSVPTKRLKFRSAVLPPMDFPKLTDLLDQSQSDDIGNLTFLAAVPRGRETPEISIEGKQRGALSWAFARGIEGAADKDHDGVLTEQELFAYLLPTVNSLAEAQQNPDLRPLQATRAAILNLGGGQQVAALSPGVTKARLNIAIDGTAPAGFRPPADTSTVTDQAKADLIWNASTGTVEHRLGGVVTNDVKDAAAMNRVIAKWLVLGTLYDSLWKAPLSLYTDGPQRLFIDGQRLRVESEVIGRPKLTLFNLTPDGQVEYLFPIDQKEQAEDYTKKPIALPLKVTGPVYGAQHLVAIASEQPLTALHAELRAMEKAGSLQGLAGLLSTALADGKSTVGIVPIYTARTAP